MSDRVVVLGAGYAGVGAVRSFQEAAPGDAELVWVSERDYHLVLHEVHRVIRDPGVGSKVTIPVEEIRDDDTRFVRGHVTAVDVDAREVHLDDGSTVGYDYLLVGLGSATAFYGIEGLREHALTLKSLDDAREINAAVREAASGATREAPAQVVVGGAGLSGIQAAGEIAEWRDGNNAPVEIKLVEGLDEVFPGNDSELQGALRTRIEAKGIDVLCGDFISEVDGETVYLGGGEEPAHELPYDVLVWTGGITGPGELRDADLGKDDRSGRIEAASDFRTSDDRVFAIGDTALVEQDDEVAPPTAQAAWDAAEVAGRNLARAVRGEPLRTWTYRDKGTLVSIGDEAVAHEVEVPGLAPLLPRTFGGSLATVLKKGVACRWIADVSGLDRAVAAWSDM
jgi:NADH dehydrogenase